jgi:hypothetical protein
MNEIIRDGGVKSRKLWFSVFAITTLFIGALLAGKFPPFAALYGDLVGGIVGIAGLYLTGNIAQKWVGTKAPMETKAEPAKPGKKTQPLEAEDPPAKPPENRFPEDE